MLPRRAQGLPEDSKNLPMMAHPEKNRPANSLAFCQRNPYAAEPGKRTSGLNFAHSPSESGDPSNLYPRKASAAANTLTFRKAGYVGMEPPPGSHRRGYIRGPATGAHRHQGGSACPGGCSFPGSLARLPDYPQRATSERRESLSARIMLEPGYSPPIANAELNRNKWNKWDKCETRNPRRYDEYRNSSVEINSKEDGPAATK